MHFAIHQSLFLAAFLFGRIFQDKTLTRIIFIRIHRKGCKRHHIDSVSVLDQIQITIPYTGPDHRCDTCKLSGCSTHPDHIVVSPLNVKRMVLLQTIHDQIRRRSTVIHITQNMQVIDNQSLDQFRQCDNKIIRLSKFNDRIDNRFVISFFIKYFLLLRNQFLNYIRIILRQRFTHLRSCIF